MTLLTVAIHCLMDRCIWVMRREVSMSSCCACTLSIPYHVSRSIQNVVWQTLVAPTGTSSKKLGIRTTSIFSLQSLTHRWQAFPHQKCPLLMGPYSNILPLNASAWSSIDIHFAWHMLFSKICNQLKQSIVDDARIQWSPDAEEGRNIWLCRKRRKKRDNDRQHSEQSLQKVIFEQLPTFSMECVRLWLTEAKMSPAFVVFRTQNRIVCSALPNPEERWQSCAW